MMLVYYDDVQCSSFVTVSVTVSTVSIKFQQVLKKRLITVLLSLIMTSSKPLPISTQEEKEIHLAFEWLSDFPLKNKLKQEIKDIETWIDNDKAKSNQYGYIEPVALIKKSLIRRDEIEKELEFIKNKTDKKVTAADVTEMFKFLNYKVGKHEVEEMLWEVDENLDGCLDWNEFRLMFNRNVLDQTGLEPNRMVSMLENSILLS